MVAGGTQSRWALILAGGDGRRLRPLTRQIAGDDRPKQFCPVLGGETLLEQTRRRVAALAPSERVLVVDRKSTRLNSSHANTSYAVFCLKKKTRRDTAHRGTPCDSRKHRRCRLTVHCHRRRLRETAK